MDIDTLHEFSIDFEHLSRLVPNANIQTKNWLLQLFDRLDSLDSQKASLLGNPHSMDNQGIVEDIEKKIVSTNETIDTILTKEGVRLDEDQFSEFADIWSVFRRRKPYHENLEVLSAVEREIAIKLMREERLTGDKLRSAVRAELIARGRRRQKKVTVRRERIGGKQGDEAHHDYDLDPQGPPMRIKDRGKLTKLRVTFLKDLKGIKRKAQVLTGRGIVDKRTKRGKIQAAIEPADHVVGGLLREVDAALYRYVQAAAPLDGWLNKNPTKEHHAVLRDINTILKSDKKLPPTRVQYAEDLYSFAAFFPERQEDNWVVAFDVGDDEVLTRVFPLESFPSMQSVIEQIKMTVPDEWEVINIGEPFALDRVREELEGEGFSPVSTMKNLWRTFTDNLHNFASDIGPEGGLRRLRKRGFGKDTKGSSVRLTDKSAARNKAENDLMKWSHNNPVEVKTHIERAKRDMQTVFSTDPLTVGKMMDALQQAKIQADHSAAGLDSSTELAQMGIIETHWQNKNVVVSEGGLQYANRFIKDASDSINDLLKTIRGYSIIQGNRIADDRVRRVLKTFAREARDHVPKMLEKPRRVFFTEESDGLHEFASIANVIDEYIRTVKQLTVELGRKKQEVENQLFEPNSYRTYKKRVSEDKSLYDYIVKNGRKYLSDLASTQLDAENALWKVLENMGFGIDEHYRGVNEGNIPISRQDSRAILDAEADWSEEVEDMASITEDGEWGEHITFAEMRDLDVQVKRTRDPYNSGDIHVEMRVIDPTFGPEGDQISSGQGYIDARTPNILDVEFVSSLGMSTREWMLQVVPKLKSVLGVNRIQGYRATGAKSRREIKTIEDQNPLKNIQVIEFAE